MANWTQSWVLAVIVTSGGVCGGQLPPLFAVPAGLGDLAVGLAAPMGSPRVGTRDRPPPRRQVQRARHTDLVVALGTGLLSALILAGPSNAALGTLPLALIPTTAVPLAAALHILSLRRLTTTPADTPAGTPRQTGMAAASR